MISKIWLSFLKPPGSLDLLKWPQLKYLCRWSENLYLVLIVKWAIHISHTPDTHKTYINYRKRLQYLTSRVTLILKQRTQHRNIFRLIVMTSMISHILFRTKFFCKAISFFLRNLIIILSSLYIVMTQHKINFLRQFLFISFINNLTETDYAYFEIQTDRQTWLDSVNVPRY